MSENYRYYQDKMAARRAGGAASERLREQLWELMRVVAWCERVWALEDRIERSL